MVDTKDIKNESCLTLRERQLASLEILKTVIQICNHKGLRYWLWYGSLLGAVRHKGFIPWDDDLDIGMPRDDYEKLLNYFAKHVNELHPLRVINTLQYPTCPFMITRISDTRFKMVGEFGTELHDLGIFIDIYPFDGLGNEEAIAYKAVKKDKALAKAFVRSTDCVAHNRKVGPTKKIGKRIYRRFLLKPSDCYANELRMRAREFPFDDSSYVAIRVWPDSYEHQGFFSRSSFDYLIEAPFEKISVSIPQNYEEVLEQIYHDYLVLPPEGERVGHHEYEIYLRG